MPNYENGSNIISKPLSGINYIDFLLFEDSKIWESNQITYSFPFKNSNESFFSDIYKTPATYTWDWYNSKIFGLSNDAQISTKKAFEEWSNVANINFIEIPEIGTNVGDIRITHTDEYNNGVTAQDTGTLGFAYRPEYSDPLDGDIWLADWLPNNWEKGYSDNYLTILHEIGHALGLNHPQKTDKSLDEFDFTNYTVMSYNNDKYDQGQVFFESGYEGIINPIQTPMVYDIAAIQYLYGPNKTFNLGDNIYQFDNNKAFLKSIWDAGGNDTLDFKNFIKNCDINLEPGSYSTIRCNKWAVTDNLGIAFETYIENVIAGRGDDVISGNSLSNEINGSQGNDLISGEKGDDILLGGEGNDTLNGNDGNDMFFGGVGRDILTGGEGNDSFVFEKYSDLDFITDFVFNEDKVLFEGFDSSSIDNRKTIFQDGFYYYIILENNFEYRLKIKSKDNLLNKESFNPKYENSLLISEEPTSSDGTTYLSFDAAYEAGKASVDITSDNAAVLAQGIAQGIELGIASVDITSDNAAAITAALTAKDGTVYTSIDEALETAKILALTTKDGKVYETIDAAIKSIESLLSNTSQALKSVGSIADQTVEADSSIILSDFISKFESDGDIITWFNIWDSTGSNNFAINGNPVDASSGRWIEANQLSSISLIGDSSSSTQTIYIQSYDGLSLSAWDSFTLITTGGMVKPVGLINDQTIKVGSSIDLSDFISQYDSDGNTITWFNIWDGTGVNNVQVKNLEVDATSGHMIAGESLDDASLVGDSFPSEQILYVQYYDGTSWSDWDSFSIITT